MRIDKDRTEFRALETKLKTASPSPTAAKARFTAMTSECQSVRCVHGDCRGLINGKSGCVALDAS
jgi:hypothetical protein